MSALALALVVLAAGEPAWDLVGDTGGVKVFVRDAPAGGLREVRAEIVVPTPPSRVLAVLSEVEHYPEFMPYVVEARRLSVFPGGHYEYQQLDPPFVDKRDFAVRVDVSTDAAGVVEWRWREANDHAPAPRDGTVRVAVNRGSWTLEPLAGGRTLLRYFVHTDPGGAIPAWLASKANSTSVPELLAAVRSRAVDPSWRRPE